MILIIIFLSYTNEINELKSTITTLQCDIKKLENNERLVTNSRQIIAKPKQELNQDHDAKQIMINNVSKSMELDTKTTTGDQTSNNKLAEEKTTRVCPGCHETAYGLMVSYIIIHVIILINLRF